MVRRAFITVVYACGSASLNNPFVLHFVWLIWKKTFKNHKQHNLNLPFVCNMWFNLFTPWVCKIVLNINVILLIYVQNLRQLPLFCVLFAHYYHHFMLAITASQWTISDNKNMQHVWLFAVPGGRNCKELTKHWMGRNKNILHACFLSFYLPVVHFCLTCIIS